MKAVPYIHHSIHTGYKEYTNPKKRHITVISVCVGTEWNRMEPNGTEWDRMDGVRVKNDLSYQITGQPIAH